MRAYAARRRLHDSPAPAHPGPRRASATSLPRLSQPGPTLLYAPRLPGSSHRAPARGDCPAFAVAALVMPSRLPVLSRPEPSRLPLPCRCRVRPGRPDCPDYPARPHPRPSPPLTTRLPLSRLRWPTRPDGPRYPPPPRTGATSLRPPCLRRLVCLSQPVPYRQGVPRQARASQRDSPDFPTRVCPRPADTPAHHPRRPAHPDFPTQAVASRRDFPGHRAPSLAPPTSPPLPSLPLATGQGRPGHANAGRLRHPYHAPPRQRDGPE